MCPFWTGDGCICGVIYVDRADRDEAIARLDLPFPPVSAGGSAGPSARLVGPCPECGGTGTWPHPRGDEGRPFHFAICSRAWGSDIGDAFAEWADESKALAGGRGTAETSVSEWQERAAGWVDSRFDDDLLQRGLVGGEEAGEVLQSAVAYSIAVAKAQRCILKARQDIKGGTEHWMNELRGEVADAFLTLASMAHRAGFSLADAVEAKWSEIADRTYSREDPLR